jgi:hypothetical protein
MLVVVQMMSSKRGVEKGIAESGSGDGVEQVCDECSGGGRQHRFGLNHEMRLVIKS